MTELSLVDNVLQSAATEFNDLCEPGKRIEMNGEFLLFGSESNLDSMDLANFLIGIEEKLSDNGYEISMLDEKAFSQKNSPFRSISSLTQFIAEKIAESA